MARAPLSLKAKLGIAGACVAITAATVAAPAPPGTLVRRLANAGAGRHDPDSPNPLTTAPLDAEALRRAGAIVRGGALFLEFPRVNAQLAHDLLGATTVLVPDARPAERARDASWILAYGVHPSLPPGTSARRTWRLAPSVTLVEVRR
jgi:hypothetical protein